VLIKRRRSCQRSPARWVDAIALRAAAPIRYYRLVFKHSQLKVPGGAMHVVENGREQDAPILFIHGWPQDWSSWTRILELAGQQHRAIAVDLPGIGESHVEQPPTRTWDIAQWLHAVVDALGLKRVLVVGHDIGGMVAFSYLSRYSGELAGAVIMDVVIPGLPPWEEVRRNPSIWHWSFHAVPDLPEKLVLGKEREYFDFFYDAISAHPERITGDARNRYIGAYSNPAALGTGFRWFRAFPQNAKDNRELATEKPPIATPVLVIRGSKEGSIEAYVNGLRVAGCVAVDSAVITDCGHFAPEEQADLVWHHIEQFADAIPRRAVRQATGVAQ
jgi:pimeloyl-ACP methyl ester carboxylesterase